MDVQQYGQTWQTLEANGQTVANNTALGGGTKEYIDTLKKLNFNVIQTIGNEVISAAENSQ